jgi:hypothetical protein
MKLDVRIPLGMLFTLMGTILAAYGMATRNNADFYAKSFDIDLNLWWGLVLLAFGITMLMLGRSGQMKMEKAGNKPPQRLGPVAGGPGREQGDKGTRKQGLGNRH